MTVVYPVVFTPLEEGGYLAYVPDLKIHTHGEDLAQAILMARDAIGVIGLDIGRRRPAACPLQVGPAPG